MMRFFILAAGLGKRAEPLSFFKPKPVFPLNGIPLIQIMLDQLKKLGLKKGFINLHHLPKAIEQSIQTDLQVHLFYESALSGSKILTQTLAWDFEYLLVINGDIFLEIPLAQMEKKIQEAQTDGLLVVRTSPQTVYSSILIKDDDFLGIDKRAGFWMYTGVTLLKRKIIEKIADINFFESLIRNRCPIKVISYDQIWLDLGDPQLYFQANFEYLNHINSRIENSLSDHVKISTDSQVHRSVIWENTIICDHCRIKNCLITGDLTLNQVSWENKIITPQKVYDFKPYGFKTL